MQYRKTEVSSDGGNFGKKKMQIMLYIVWQNLNVAKVMFVVRSVLCWFLCQESGFSRCEYNFILNVVSGDML